MEPSVHRSPLDPAVLAPPAVSRWERTFASLANPNFRLFFIGQMTSMLGSWMSNTAEAWLTFDRTHDEWWNGFVSMLGLLPLIFSPVAVVLLDRFSKRRVLVVVTLLNFSISLVTALLIFTHVIRVWQIALFSGLGGLVFAAEMPMRQSLIYDMVGKESLLNALALNTALFQITRALGPAIAGVVIGVAGPGWCFLIDAISFLAVLGAYVFIQLPGASAKPSDGSWTKNLAEGFRYVRGHGMIVTLVSLMAVAGLFGYWYSSQMPSFNANTLKGGPKQLGALLGANGLGALMAALWLAGQGNELNRKKLVFRMQWMFGAALVLLSATRAPWLTGAVSILAGWSMVTFFSTANTLIQTEVPDALRVRVLGVWALVFGGSMPVGQYVMGSAAAKWGVPLVMAVGGGIVFLFSTALFLFRGRRA